MTMMPTPIKLTPTPMPASAPVDRPKCWEAGAPLLVVKEVELLVVRGVELLVVLVAVTCCDVGEKPVAGM